MDKIINMDLINMDLIINMDDYKIFLDKEKGIFSIKFEIQNPIIINSIIKTKLLPGASSDENNKIIKFKANSVKTLQQFQKENNYKKMQSTALLIQYLTKQLNYLITEENHSILGFSLKNTIVVNEQKFIFLGLYLILEIDNNDEIMICKPFTINDFFNSIELKKISYLPSSIHYKTAFYSLGLLALSLLIGNNEFYKDYIHKQLHPMEALENHYCKNTKIYWLLSRCFIEEPKERSIFFI